MAELGTWLVEVSWLWASLSAAFLGILVFRTSHLGLDWAPILVMTTVPFQREWLFGRDDVQVTLTQVALCAFFAGSLIRLARGDLRLTIDAATIFVGLVVSIYGLSVGATPDFGLWAAESYRWLVAALFFVVARSYFNAGSGQRILIALSCGILLAAGLAASQVILEDGPASFVRDGQQRAHGWFGEPNPFAAFIWCVTLPVIAYALLSRDQSKPTRIAAGVAGTVGVVALGLTQSRGGVLGMGAGLTVIALVLLASQRGWVLRTAVAATAIVAAFALMLVVRTEPWSVTKDATAPANWAEQERVAHWSAAVQMVQAHPLGGVGAGGFTEQFRSYTAMWRFRISQGHAHNAYLQVAAEVGLPGLLAYGLTLAVILAALIRRARLVSEFWLPLGALAVTAALMTHQVVDFLHVLSLGLLFAGLWAASLSSGLKGMSSSEHHIAF
jgi:O-antigen ligase